MKLRKFAQILSFAAIVLVGGFFLPATTHAISNDSVSVSPSTFNQGDVSSISLNGNFESSSWTPLCAYVNNSTTVRGYYPRDIVSLSYSVSPSGPSSGLSGSDYSIFGYGNVVDCATPDSGGGVAGSGTNNVYQFNNVQIPVAGLAPGNYTLSFDSTETYGSCGGSQTCNGQTINFTGAMQISFTINPPIRIDGCMDPNASNYNPSATNNVGCQYPAPGNFGLSASACYDAGGYPAIDLWWDQSSGANGYDIFRRIWSNGAWNWIASTGQTNYTSPEGFGGDYYYYIEAYNNYGRTDSNIAMASCPSTFYPPTVNLKFNGLDGPVNDWPVGNSGTLSWNETNSDSCTASGGWAGSWNYTASVPNSGSVNSGAINSNTTFTLTCYGPQGQAADSVTVNIHVNQLPTGSLNTVNPTTIAGSASDPDHNGAAIQVYIYNNGASLLTGSTNGSTFSFATPPSLCDGASHSIAAYGVDLDTGAQVQLSNSPQNLTCTPPTLNVSKTGTGSGTVTSSPAGINCGGTCSANFLYSTTVTLTATASAGSTFTGWSGEGCSGTGTCTVVMTQTRNVSANFNINSYTLTISMAGNGSGTVSGAGSYTYGQTAPASATASAGSTFAGWSGNCSGTGSPFPVLMDGNKSCTATFTLNNYTLTVNKAGSGAGTVGGAGPYQYLTTAHATAAATASDSTFVGWSGACVTTDINGCFVVMTGDQSVTATFNQVTASISASPNPIFYNTSSTISWSSGSAASCSVAPTGWTGTTGSQPTGNLTADTTYTVTCNGSGTGGTASASVTVRVAPQAPTLNSLNNAPCNTMAITFTDNSTNEDGFTVWRSTTSGSGYSNVSGNLPAHGGTGTQVTFTDSPPAVNTVYYYVVDSYNAVSAPLYGQSNQLSAMNLACTANFGNSSMFISKVNGAAYSGATTINNSDTITYQITMVNTGPGNGTVSYLCETPSSNLINTRNLAVSGSGSSANGVGSCGSTPKLNISGVKNIPNNWLVTFDVTLSSTSPNTQDLVSNQATIYYSDQTGAHTYTVTAPTLLVNSAKGKAPNFREVAP